MSDCVKPPAEAPIQPDQLTAVNIFVRVVDEQGFSAAARSLGLSTSYVSRQLSSLESRLGVRLLNRSTRRQSLTPVGALYYRTCSSILAQLEEAELAVTQLQSVPRGLLRVAAPVAFGERYVAPILATFLAEHAQLEVELIVEDRRINPTEEGFDVVVRAGEPSSDALLSRRLCPMTRVLVAAPGYVNRHDRLDTLDDLEKHATLHHTGSGSSWELANAAGTRQTASIQPVLASSSQRSVRLACLAGRGIALLPDWLVGTDVRNGHLVRILPGLADTSAGVFAVYPEHKHLSARVRLFVDSLADSFTDTPGWALDIDTEA